MSSTVDDLEARLALAKRTEEKIDLLHQIAHLTHRNNPARALELEEQALRLAVNEKQFQLTHHDFPTRDILETT